MNAEHEGTTSGNAAGATKDGPAVAEQQFDWNVVVSVRPDAYRKARRLLCELGPVRKTDFYNVLLIRVEDIDELPETLARWQTINPHFTDLFSRIAPAAATFDFHSLDTFREEACAAVLRLAPPLEGRSFHVRIHRRGLRQMFSTREEESRLDDALLAALSARGRPGRIAFDDPDAVVVIDTVNNRAGIALWSRDDLKRLPCLKAD